MKAIAMKITVSDEIFENEFAYMYGDKKDEKVIFTYIRKDGTEIDRPLRNYKEAITLARGRARDGRYRNYEFVISK